MRTGKAWPARASASRCVLTLALMVVLPGVLISPALAQSAADEQQSLPHSPVPRVDRERLLGFLADNNTLTLIDARSPEEYAEAHLPGAINVPFDAVDANAGLMPDDPSEMIVVYCRTGTRAGLLKEQLVAEGYTDVQVLPREQIHWQENFMVFNCGTEPAATVADPSTQARSTDE
jgi:rhodanese-related sulfurtransferase